VFDNLWYLVLAFGVIWAAAFGYLAYVALLARSVRREVETLTEAIAAGALTPEETPAERGVVYPPLERLVGTEPTR